MRVLIATSTFPLGGESDATPRFVLDLAQALARTVDVTVLAPGAPGVPARDRLGGVDVHRFDYFRPRRLQRLAYHAGMPDNLRRSAWARAQVPGYLACAARAIRRLAAETGAEVVHSHWALPQGLAGAWARGRRRRFAHVATLHGSDAHLLAQVPAARTLARWVDARCDAWIAAASPLRHRLDATLGRPSRATVLPVGVDTRRFRVGCDEGRGSPFPGGHLLFVGRLVPIKGVDVLLQSLARVRATDPGLELVVLGDGPEAPRLRARCRALGLADAVRFAGAVGQDEVAAALQACRAVVVASDAGGIADVVTPGHDGWLARAGDADDLARAIAKALASPAPPGARKTAEAHDWRVVAERHLAIYESSLRGVGG